MSNKDNIINFEKSIKKLGAVSGLPSEQSKEVVLQSEKKKLIAFPGSPITSIQEVLGADKEIKTILGGRVIATLLGMFVLTIAAQSLWFSKDTSSSRSLASAEERGLAGVEAYLSSSKRSVSSVATLPSTIEDFNFGALHGRYTIKTAGMLITSLSSNGQFIKIGSAARFLKKHKKLWHLQFASLKLSHINKHSKIYTLLDSSHKVLGQATVGLDMQGNLQSLSFTKEQL